MANNVLSICSTQWNLQPSETYGAKVAACYMGAAEECRQFDQILGKQLYSALFSPSIDEKIVRKNEAKFGKGFELLLKHENALLFNIADEIQKADDRQRLYTGNWSPLNKRTDLVSRDDFVARSELQYKDAYFDKMRTADLLFLPVIKAARRRLKMLNENVKLMKWEARSSLPARVQTAKGLEAELPELVNAVQTVNKIQIQIPALPEKVSRFLTLLKKLLATKQPKSAKAADLNYARILNFTT